MPPSAVFSVSGAADRRSADHAHAHDGVERGDLRRHLLADHAAGVDDRVGHIAARLVDHVLNVDVLLADQVQEAVDHAGDIPVDDAQAADAGALQGDARQVDAVFDVAVAEIVGELARGHDGALLLALRGGGADVRHGDDVGDADDAVVREIGDVAGDLAGVDAGDQRLVVHQLAAGEVDDAHAVLHLGEGLRVQHVARLVVVVDLDHHVVAHLEERVDVGRVVDGGVEAPGGVHGHVGVVAVDGHAELGGGVRDE